ncbi:hypothetical protein L1887_59700 [Cichorium endivia]|nr:hypothetical protein L1887_59700 [Cichorium endivia]
MTSRASGPEGLGVVGSAGMVAAEPVQTSSKRVVVEEVVVVVVQPSVRRPLSESDFLALLCFAIGARNNSKAAHKGSSIGAQGVAQIALSQCTSDASRRELGSSRTTKRCHFSRALTFRIRRHAPAPGGAGCEVAAALEDRRSCLHHTSSRNRAHRRAASTTLRAFTRSSDPRTWPTHAACWHDGSIVPATMIDLVLILVIKLALYLSARAALPFLFGHARYASLDTGPKTSNAASTSLPAPVTASRSFSAGGSLHDDDDHRTGNGNALGNSPADTSPFLAISANSSLPSLTQFKAALFAPVRVRHAHGGLDLASVAGAAVLAGVRGVGVALCRRLARNGWLRGRTRNDAASLVALLARRRARARHPADPARRWTPLYLSHKLQHLAHTQARLARAADVPLAAGLLQGGLGGRGTAERQAAASSDEERHPARRASRSSAPAPTSRRGKRIWTVCSTTRQVRPAPAGTCLRCGGGDSRSREIKALKSEIFGLSAIAGAMRDDLDRMTSLQHKDELSATLLGKLWILVGWGWAAYCAFRIGLSMLNLLVLGYRDTAPPDFISLSIAYVMRIFDVNLDVAAWTKQVSLLFVGFLIWGRIGSVLAFLGSAFRAAGSGVSSSFLVLFLAEIMTIYLLATLIQLRSSLPASVSPPTPLIRDISAPNGTGVPPLLATLPSFQVVFGSLFDSAFLLAAAITAAWKYIVYMQRSASGDGGVLFGGGNH